MDQDHSPEDQAIDGATALTAYRWGPGYRLHELVLRVEGPNGEKQKLSIDPAAWHLARAAEAARNGADVASVVVQVLQRSSRPLKGAAIARRAGKPYTPHFRTVLSRLVKDGIVRKVSGSGYWLASRSMSEEMSGEREGDRTNRT